MYVYIDRLKLGFLGNEKGKLQKKKKKKKLTASFQDADDVQLIKHTSLNESDSNSSKIS